MSLLKRHVRKSRELNAEINITAFMNLMVVLVPFLLITAVFSQVSVLDLSLPNQSADTQTSEPNPPKVLEIVVRQQYFDVQEQNDGLLKRIEQVEGSPDFKELNLFLQQVKSHPEFNQQTSVTLLMEMDISYQVLVQTMDAVRMTSWQLVDSNSPLPVKQPAELFPDISFGDAPDLNVPIIASQVAGAGL